MNTTNKDAAAAREAPAKRANASAPASEGLIDWKEYDRKGWERERRKREALADEFAAVLKASGIRWERDIEDGWLVAYELVKAMNEDRGANYRKAKLNLALRECRELLQRVDSASIIKGGVKDGARVEKGNAVEMGGDGRAWLLERIEEYFESERWHIYSFYLYRGAEYEDGEDKFGWIRDKETMEAHLMKQQAAFVGNYENMRGRGSAKQLGMFVNTFLEVEAPAWAAALSKAERYRVIGDLLNKAGILEEYKGKEWLETNWEHKDKKEMAKAVEMWGKQAEKV